MIVHWIYNTAKGGSIEIDEAEFVFDDQEGIEGNILMRCTDAAKALEYCIVPDLAEHAKRILEASKGQS